MKHCIVIAVLTLLLAPSVLAQQAAKRGLVLTGSVVGVKPAFDCEENEFAFDVELYLQFRNEAENTIVIFGQGFLGTTKLSFLDPNNSAAGEWSTEDQWWKKEYTNMNYDPFPAFIRTLEVVEPRSPYFVLIPPGGYYEGRQFFRVKAGYKLVLIHGRKLSEMRAIPEYPGLRLEYYLSMKDRQDPNLLDSTNRAWKRYGQLPLDSSGNYSIKSEIILNKLAN